MNKSLWNHILQSLPQKILLLQDHLPKGESASRKRTEAEFLANLSKEMLDKKKEFHEKQKVLKLEREISI